MEIRGKCMSERIITRETTVCFTGHRPEKLPDNGDANSPLIKALKSMLFREISSALEDGCNCFITGLSRGVDLWAGEIIMGKIAAGRDICLAAASPCRSYGRNFKGYEKWIFKNIIHKAERVFYISEEYTKTCYKDRNAFMVENSGRLIAVVKDFRSGTGNTISTAKKHGLDIRLVNVNGLEAGISDTFELHSYFGMK